jgi:hypothetical protein
VGRSRKQPVDELAHPDASDATSGDVLLDRLGFRWRDRDEHAVFGITLVVAHNDEGLVEARTSTS